jgi:hypothetical protein
VNETTRARLTLAALAYLILTVIHDLDHLRQGRPLALEVKVVGVVAIVTAVACVVLSLRGHTFAPLACLITGAGSVLGLVVVHLVPRWSAISDPYPDAGVDALAYGIVIALMASGAYLALEGYRSLREISAAD